MLQCYIDLNTQNTAGRRRIFFMDQSNFCLTSKLNHHRYHSAWAFKVFVTNLKKEMGNKIVIQKMNNDWSDV
jgi:hypothetical protein